jgi:hypothetical protein
VKSRIEVENGGERSEQEIQLVDDGKVHPIHLFAGVSAMRTLEEATVSPKTTT